MLADVIKKQVENTIENKYGHAKTPQIVLCKVTNVLGNEVNLKVLNENGVVDDSFAELPKVKVNRVYEKGDVVIVLFLYGKLERAYVFAKYEF